MEKVNDNHKDTEYAEFGDQIWDGIITANWNVFLS